MIRHQRSARARTTGAALAAITFSACIRSELSKCEDGRVCEAGFVCRGVVGCVWGGCGNARRERFEECDDGNSLSHDGCSSGCLTEYAAWTTLETPGVPTMLILAALAYDPDRGRIVLFGGSSSLYNVRYTLEWDGVSWTDVSPSGSPPFRSGHAMAYDAAGRRVVLFGGRDDIMQFDDTWTWDGITWTNRTPATHPAGRYGHAMALDARSARIVLFGGFGDSNNDGTSETLGDTWTWDGSEWSEVASTSPPPGRTLHAMGSSHGSRPVIFGGLAGSVGLADTWEWNGATWLDAMPALSPSARTGHAMAADERTGRVVMYGDGETWEWDGATWSQSTALSPYGTNVAMASDALRGGVLMVSYYLDVMWEYRYASETPDESCVAGEDVDGDGLAGCRDPDCWGYCTPRCPPGATCDAESPRCGDGVCNPYLETRVCPGDCP